MTQKNVYTIGKIHQLFDLNNDALNFVCNFRIMCESAEKVFEYLVLSQAQLDNVEKLPDFNKAKGIGVGQIIADKGTKENYLLALKSDEDLTVQVETHFEQLPDDYHLKIRDTPTPTQNTIHNNQNHPHNNNQTQDHGTQQYPNQKPEVIQQLIKPSETIHSPTMEHFQHSLFDEPANKESFISKLFKNKGLWLILTVIIVISIYFLFFSKKSLEESTAAVDTHVSHTEKDSMGAVAIEAAITPKEKLPSVKPKVTNIKSGKLNIDKLNKLKA